MKTLTADSFAIRTYPARVLRKQCKQVDSVSKEEKNIFYRMLTIMHNAKGIGLAAPQIGIAKQLIIADIGGSIIMLANPRIITRQRTDCMEEGCLSIPGMRYFVTRPAEVIVQGIDAQGKMQEIKAKDLLARVLQHEIDHLHGRLIIDYMQFNKRIAFKLKQYWSIIW